MLWDFLPRYDQQFGVAPAQQASAYRQLPPDVSWRRSCASSSACARWPTTTPSASTAQRYNCWSAMASGPSRPASISVDESALKSGVTALSQGQHPVVHRGRTVATKPAPAEPVVLRARSGRRPNGQPPVDSHPLLDDIGHGAQTAAPRPPAKTQARIPTKPALTHPWRRALLCIIIEQQP